jgi:hypothetical protein
MDTTITETPAECARRIDAALARVELLAKPKLDRRARQQTVAIERRTGDRRHTPRKA